MAERKYDLALVQTQTNAPVKHQEWYKERLQTKYLKQLKPGERINNQNPTNWVFLKDGLDDFRDGLPPAVQGGDFIKSKKGPGPALTNDNVNMNCVKQPAAKKRLSQYQTYLSRVTPQQQQRRDYITEVEQGLLKHPLALYPHLEESVAPERRPLLKSKVRLLSRKRDYKYKVAKLFEDIVDLLDPQFNIQEMQEDDMDDIAKFDESADDPAYSAQSDRTKDENKAKEMEGPPQRNLYRWLPRKETKKDGKKGGKEKEKPWPTSPSEEEHIKKVTQEFCDWVADLGGESNNIEESTITSLFASGYETKPALSVPIHVVELTNVPQELRMSAAIPPPAPPEKASSIGKEPVKKISGDYEPSWVKFRYGAWYLNPRSWKKMDFYEPLLDPKQLKDHELSEAKKKSHELTNELSSMHASKAFGEFISKKNTRRPEFLSEIAEIQRKAAEEEQRRIEMELLSKQRRSNVQLRETAADSPGH